VVMALSDKLTKSSTHGGARLQTDEAPKATPGLPRVYRSVPPFPYSYPSPPLIFYTLEGSTAGHPTAAGEVQRVVITLIDFNSNVRNLPGDLGSSSCPSRYDVWPSLINAAAAFAMDFSE